MLRSFSIVFAGLTACSASPEDTAGAPVGDTAAEVGCGSDTGGVPTWAGFGDAFFTTWCQSCHATDSPQRYGAPEGVVFDRRDDVVRQRVAIADSVLTRGSMPVGGGLSDAERAQLEALLCALEP